MHAQKHTHIYMCVGACLSIMINRMNFMSSFTIHVVFIYFRLSTSITQIEQHLHKFQKVILITKQ